MVSVVVDRIGVHVTNAEDVDEHTEEGGDKEEHHSDVIDVNTDTEGLSFDFEAISTHPSKGEPVTDVVSSCTLSYEFGNEEHGENKTCDHNWKCDEPSFLCRLNPRLVSIEDVSKEENDWECKHRQENDENCILNEC